MPNRFSPALTSFNAGEWGNFSFGRVDLENYQKSLRLCDNWIPTIQGPLRKRPGTKFIASTKTQATEKARLIPYILNQSESYMLEFGNLYIRFFNSDGTVIGGPLEVVTPYADTDVFQIQFTQDNNELILVHPDFSPHILTFDGSAGFLTEQVYDFGPLRLENADQTGACIVSILAGGVSGTGITLGAVVVGCAPTVFTTDMVAGTGTDGQLIAFRTIPQALYDEWVTGTVYGVNSYVWSESYETPGRINVYKTALGGTAGTRTPGHDEGIESDGVITDWQMVHTEWGFVRVKTFINIVQATGDVVGFPEIPADAIVGNGSVRWSYGSWSGEFGYPATAAFHEQRIFFGGNKNAKGTSALQGGSFSETQTLWGSEVSEFINFLPGLTGATSALNYKMNSNEANPISYMVSSRVLAVGTEGGEFIVRGGGIAEGTITSTNIVITRDSRHGSKSQNAVGVGAAVLFVQSGNQILRELAFRDNSNGYSSADLSLLAHTIGELGLNEIAYQAEQDSIIWTYSDGGILIGMTYEREEGVIGWHRHNIGRSTDTVAVVESVAVIPDTNGVNDKLWIIVKRTINSVVTRFVEVASAVSDNTWSDSHITFSGGATDTITGLTHLEGEVVKVVGDGANLPDATVSGGQIVLANPVTSAVVGLGYTAAMETQKIEGGSRIGIAQGKLGKVNDVIMRLYNTGAGLFIGPNSTNLTNVLNRNTQDNMDSSVPLFTGDTDNVSIKDDSKNGRRIYVEHNLPNEANLIAMWPQIDVTDIR